MFLISQLRRLLKLLQSQSIEAIAFKGPVLAIEAYGSASLRESGDLDLLVRRRDVVRARWLFIDNGFEAIFPTASDREAAYLQSLTGRGEEAYVTTHAEHHLLNRHGMINVDLHWGLTLREFWVLPDPDEPWDWATPRLFAGEPILGFEPAAMLLVLCINGAKDCWDCLDRVCDIAAVISSEPGVDRQRAIEIAKKAGAVRMLLTGLNLADQLLGAALPALLINILCAISGLPRLVEELIARMFTTTDGKPEEASFEKSLLHLRMRERWRDRMGYCVVKLRLTVGDWSSIPLPAWASFGHYLLRPGRLMLKYCSRIGAKRSHVV